MTDQDLYKVAEHWTYPEDQGDCEDYVLLKKYYLAEMGWPTDALLITVVLDEQGAGHAVLTVKTGSRRFLSSTIRTPEILPWQDTPYRYIKRQSQAHPSVWGVSGPDIFFKAANDSRKADLGPLTHNEFTRDPVDVPLPIPSRPGPTPEPALSHPGPVHPFFAGPQKKPSDRLEVFGNSAASSARSVRLDS